jgi:O-antigen ligase
MTSTVLASPLDGRTRLDAAVFLVLAAFVSALQISIAAADILLAITFVGWAASVAQRQERVEVPRMFWALVAYAAATLISAAFSSNPAVSLADCKQLVLLLIVPVVFRLARDRRARSLATLIITVGAVSAIVGIVQYGILHYDNLGRRPQGTLTHYMTYSGLLMLVVGSAAARLIYRDDDRVWPALVMPALLAALALTFTRSAWVGALAAVALLLLIKDRRLLALLPVAFALFVALAPPAVNTRLWSMFDPLDPTNRDRVAMLRSGVQMVRDHPVTGVGPNMVQEVYAAYRDPGAVEAITVHLHNVPMQIAAERGLPALAIWLTFLAMVVSDMWRILQTGRCPSLAAGGLAAVVAMFAAGLFEYNFGDSEFLMLFLVLITLPYAAERASDGAAA